MSWPALRVTYGVQSSSPADLDARVESLLLEQTVELPRTALRDPFVLDEIVGRLIQVEPIREGDYRVIIDFPIKATADDPAQFLNVLFGNSSLQEHVRLIDFVLPTEWPGMSKALPGPQFGTQTWRSMLGAEGRPVTCTALKPIGTSVQRIAELAGMFALAGIDVIKDDHGLANQPFHPFEERVRACQAAVAEANKVTGRKSVYAPNLIGTSSTILNQLKFALEEGVGAIMVAPMLVGLPLMAEIATEFSDVPILGHPSFAGALRVSPELMFGKIFPLFGADATIYANFGGRFSYSKETCRAIANELTQPTTGILPTLPVPAGGIKYHRVQENVEFYGDDVMLLIGGGLYEAKDDAELKARAEEFVLRCAKKL